MVAGTVHDTGHLDELRHVVTHNSDVLRRVTIRAPASPAVPTPTPSHSYFWLIHYRQDNGLTNPPDRCESSTITHNDS